MAVNFQQPSLMGQDQTYSNQLRNLVTNPGSFSGTPGFQFALDTGLGAVNRSNSSMRNSGNALAALTNYGTGLANQNYNQAVTQMGQLAGQEQNYGLGLGNLANTSQGNANSLALGNAANANQTQSIANQMQLGTGQLGASLLNNQNQYSLGLGQLNNTAQNNQMNYNLGLGQNANQASANQNQYNLGTGQNYNNYLNALTNQSGQQATDWYNQQNNQRAWYNTLGR